MLDRLVDQVTLPVRWDLCMATMAELGVHATAELPPAGALTGLAKRELTGTTTARPEDPGRPGEGGRRAVHSDEE